MRLPLLISASSCQEAPVIHLFDANWKLYCEDNAVEFLAGSITKNILDSEVYTKDSIVKGPIDIKVTKLTTNKPCSIYAELVRASPGSS